MQFMVLDRVNHILMIIFLYCSKIYFILGKVSKYTQKGGEVFSLEYYFLLIVVNAVLRKYSSSTVVSQLPLEVI